MKLLEDYLLHRMSPDYTMRFITRQLEFSTCVSQEHGDVVPTKSSKEIKSKHIGAFSLLYY
jgi:hypothetical protein